MDTAKRQRIITFILLIAMFFVCGVMGFSASAKPSPVIRTLELMAVVGVFGFLLYRIDPKPESSFLLLRKTDVLVFATFFVGGLTCAFVATEQWHTVKVLEFELLLVSFVFLDRLISRIASSKLQSFCRFVLLSSGMIVSTLILREKLEWHTVLPYVIIYPLFLSIAKRDRSKDEISYIEKEYLKGPVPGGERLEKSKGGG